MASLLPCPACKKEVSDEALFCPHCGHPLATDKTFQEQRQQLLPGLQKNGGCAVWAVVAVLCCVAFAFCNASGGVATSNRSRSEISALQRMELVFVGGFLQQQIKARLDTALHLYGLTPSEQVYMQHGSVLVKLRKEIGGFTEMELLDFAIHLRRKSVPGTEIPLPDAYALGAAALSGPR